MRIFTGVKCVTTTWRRRKSAWVMWLLVGLLSCPVLKQIDVNAPGLHNVCLRYRWRFWVGRGPRPPGYGMVVNLDSTYLKILSRTRSV